MEIIFTEHVKEGMRKRNITEEEIISAVKYPDITFKRERKYFVAKNIGRTIIQVVYEKDKYIKIITVYYL